jgi:diguanylate cyclase (GGDEF)-like protein
MLGTMNTQRGRRARAWLLRARSWTLDQQRKRTHRPATQANQEPSGDTPPTEGNNRSQTRVRTWVLLVAGLVVAAGATWGILGLHRYAALQSEAKLLLSRVETHARHLSAVEWEQVAEPQLPERSEIEENPAEVEAELGRTVEQLRRLEEQDQGIALLEVSHEGEHGQAKAVQDAYQAYQQAARTQFKRLTTGKLTQAADLDEQQVDPAFDRFSEALAEASAHYDDDADRALRLANQGTVVLVALAGLVLGGLVWRVQRAQAKAAALFAHQARHDPLTALPNRALLVEQLQGELARATRRREPVLLLWLDLDDFKVVNDSLGHQAGDQLLLAVGERLRACLRPGDTPARMGGDEFTVLLADVPSLQEAIQVAERVGKELQAPFEVAGHQVVVHASIGIAESVPGHTTATELLRNADIAMYEAKKLGKGQYQVFVPGMDNLAWKRLELEAELRVALDQGQFELYYQPILELASGAVSELEALVRWDHPSRGLLPPADFIPVAEESGLILPLGYWVLDEACRQLAAFQPHAPDRPPLGLSVNLSARQLRDPHLPQRVGYTLASTGLDPRRLTLEITETSMVDDLGSAGAALAAIRDLGVRVAIDDFGIGFSALASLKHFPVDALKIDRSFIDGLGDDSQDTAIVHAVVAFAKSLGLSVTAEGIETAAQLRQLQALGCDHGQGYYFAKPLQPGSVQPFLDTHQPLSPGRDRQHLVPGPPDLQHRRG